MRPLRLPRSGPPILEGTLLVVLGATCLAFVAVAVHRPEDAVQIGSFGRPELVGWGILALLTGGLGFGARDRRPPLVASALIASAALLGASPGETALVAALGAVGGLRRLRGLAVPRILGAAVIASSVPGILALAGTVGGVSIVDDSLPVTSLVALWVVFAVAIPVIEAVTSHVVLPPEQHVDPVHMVTRRLEPQSVLVALAVLAAITYAALGAVAGLIVLLPGAAAGVGFAAHDDGLRAVSQTLAAMTVLPEWVGIVDTGHTARVRDVVQRVCVDLHLESRLRRDVVRAAELHELGHLDGGVVRGDRGRIARSGAAVLEQAAVQDRVVRIVDATDPDRLVGARDADVELGAAIIAAACELDRMGAMADPAEAAARVQIALGKAHRSAAAFL